MIVLFKNIIIPFALVFYGLKSHDPLCSCQNLRLSQDNCYSLFKCCHCQNPGHSENLRVAQNKLRVRKKKKKWNRIYCSLSQYVNEIDKKTLLRKEGVTTRISVCTANLSTDWLQKVPSFCTAEVRAGQQ